MARSFGGLWQRITSFDNLFDVAKEAMAGSVALPPRRAFGTTWELMIHPHKYRIGPTACGEDSCGIVYFPDGPPALDAAFPNASLPASFRWRCENYHHNLDTKLPEPLDGDVLEKNLSPRPERRLTSSYSLAF
jgi:hypothetical protein